MTLATPTRSKSVPKPVPEPDKIIPYPFADSSLFLYGNPASSKVALLCAGFPDDQTVFQPFAQALSKKGDLFVGVMCLPGFEDYTDPAPWNKHKSDGYTYDEMSQCVREAAKALRAASTFHDQDTLEFIGIFHDWASPMGTQWISRAEEEAKDAAAADNIGATPKETPDKLILFDVLPNHSPEAGLPPLDGTVEVPLKTWRQCTQQHCYVFVLAVAFKIFCYTSTHVTALMAIPCFILMAILNIDCLHAFDSHITDELYGGAANKNKNIGRIFYTAYPYWYHFKSLWAEGNWKWWTGGMYSIKLHKDWKKLPILYIYGKKKKAQFHDNTTVALLEREKAEQRSLCNSIGVEGAGHTLYVQRQDECLKHVLEFIEAKNTFVS